MKWPGTDARDATCRGEEATAVVQSNEEWVGSHRRDVVLVVGNGAEVWANGGNDLICVHGARHNRYGGLSHLKPGPGDDTVITYSGDNSITDDDGDDLVYLNGGLEDAETGAGEDHIWALGANSVDGVYIDGGDGSDLLVGSPGGDSLHGGDDADVILANGAGDTVDGGAGNDELRGGPDSDNLEGGLGPADECIDEQGGANYSGCEQITVTPNPILPEKAP